MHELHKWGSLSYQSRIKACRSKANVTDPNQWVTRSSRDVAVIRRVQHQGTVKEKRADADGTQKQFIVLLGTLTPAPHSAWWAEKDS